MQVLINYPKTEEGKKQLLDNLAMFRAKLILKGIDDLDINDKVKCEVLKKVLEILKDVSSSDII